mmetsp:Transcript_13863/g.28241  ORF Transcript_13863/g.28241 Transcript_13863/m.28241 type:complete len:794 (+) Transcript_13863:2-2383(+)
MVSSLRNRGFGSDVTSLDEPLPTLREGKCYQEVKENMAAGDVQQFWSTLSIHAASTVMEFGGGNASALAAAEAILGHGEKMTRSGTITTQAVRNAASSSSIAILKHDGEDSRIASAVAVAVIKKGSALLQEMNEKRLDQTDTQSCMSILTERPTQDNSSRASSLRSKKSGNSSRGRKKKNVMINDMKKMRGSESQENQPDDNITVSSISTFGFKTWDKYATEMESDSEKEKGKKNEKEKALKSVTVTSKVVDKYATKYATDSEKILNGCLSGEASEATSRYSIDQSTIATESYHCLGKHSSRLTKEEDLKIPKYFSTPGGSLSSYNIGKKVDTLAVLGADSSDISSMRRKEEELGRKHAEFSAAAEALEKKIALAVAALEESGSSSTPKLKPDNGDSTNMKTPRLSNRGDKAKNKTSRVSNRRDTTSKRKTPQVPNYDAASMETDTIQESWTTANDSNIDDELTPPTGKQSQGRSVLGLASKLSRISEDMTEHTKDDTAGKSDNRRASLPTSFSVESDQNEGDEDDEGEEEYFEDEDDGEESIEVDLDKPTIKDKVKGFLHQKKKKVTWAATNAFKTIPARSNAGIKSAEKRLSQASRATRRALRRKRRELKRRFSRSSAGKSIEQGHDKNVPPTLSDVEVRVVTFNDAALTAEADIQPNETSSIFSGSIFSGIESRSQASGKHSQASGKHSHASGKLALKHDQELKNYMSSPITRFLDQAFYSQPERSIDEETAVTFSTNNSEAQSSVEAILELGDDLSRVTGDTSNYSSSYNSGKSRSTIGSGSNLGLRFA